MPKTIWDRTCLSLWADERPLYSYIFPWFHASTYQSRIFQAASKRYKLNPCYESSTSGCGKRRDSN